MSSRTLVEAELGDQRHADARRDEALHGGVVVGLEGDPRLEPGDRARAVDQPVALAVGGAGDPRVVREVGEPQVALVRERVVGGHRDQRTSGPRSGAGGRCRRPRRGSRESNPSARSISPLRSSGDGVLRLGHDQRQLDARSARRGRRAIASGISVAAADSNAASRSRRRARPRDGLKLGLGLAQRAPGSRRRGGRAPRRPR